MLTRLGSFSYLSLQVSKASLFWCLTGEDLAVFKHGWLKNCDFWLTPNNPQPLWVILW